MATRHSTIYICDWCRVESTNVHFLANHVTVNRRHAQINSWNVCNSCFEIGGAHIDQARALIKRDRENG